MSELIFTEPEPVSERAPVEVLPTWVSPFRNMTHTWFGVDGSEWDLSTPETGIFMLREGVTGLHLPPIDHVRRESPNVNGSMWNGYRLGGRKIAWPIYIYTDDSSEAFFDLDRRFWNSFHPDIEGTWRVTLPDGSFRELRVRLESSGGTALNQDPGLFGWQSYVIEGTADQPCWTTPRELPGSRITFDQSDQRNFFGGGGPDGSGPPLYVSPSRSEMTRKITNPGDETLYPTYRINGPMEYVEIKFGDAAPIRVNCDIQGGQWFEIATDPLRWKITDHTGANRIKSVTSWSFPAIPPRGEMDIEVTLHGVGGGSLIIDAPPLFYRAW